MSLLTLTDVKNQCDLALDITAHDVLLSELIDDYVAEAEDYIGMKLEPVTEEIVYLDGGLKRIDIPHANIGNVSIWQDSDRLWADEDIMEAEDFWVDSPRGIIRRVDGGIFLAGVAVIKVKYDGGYTPTSLPKPLKRALLKQVSYSFRRRKDLGLAAVTYPDGTINKMVTDEWLPDVEKVLDGYKRFAL